ncbi:hypothetical protein tb265_44190 [Gemmatimonadetes bacterium T265]|nr:hypothetical protein tb265_44190 [Gemmatimonadetes bacterium T265]
MTDHAHDAYDDDDETMLPAWAVAALRAPLDADAARTAGGKAHVMALVRRAPRHREGMRVAPPRWARRRGTLAPACGVAFAAVLGAFTALARHADPAARAARGGSATVLGDTVVARVAESGRALRDTLLDTLWVVRFAFRDPGARTVALAGDFNGWSRTATPLVRLTSARGGPGGGGWAATVAVPRDAVRYAFVVDGRPAGAAAAVAPPRPAGARRAPGGVGDST